MELLIVYLIVGFIVLAFTDAGSVIMKIFTFPVRVAGNIMLFLIACVAAPLMIYAHYRALKQQEKDQHY